MFLVVCAGLCLLGVVAMVVQPVLGALSSVLDIFFNLVMGEPLTGCGCLLMVGFCAFAACAAAFVASVLSTCGTPEAVNFCTLFGR